jgi:hypothetical protein
MAKKYRKLPGNTPFRTHTLLLGEHHLLYVHLQSFSEDYWRFSFEDIQAITLQKTNKIVFLSILLGTCTALSAYAFFSSYGIISDIFFLLSSIFLLFFFINLLAGQTCVCYLHTKAHPKKKLPSLRRLRSTKKAIRILKQEIEKHQGTLS